MSSLNFVLKPISLRVSIKIEKEENFYLKDSKIVNIRDYSKQKKLNEIRRISEVEFLTGWNIKNNML